MLFPGLFHICSQVISNIMGTFCFDLAQATKLNVHGLRPLT